MANEFKAFTHNYGGEREKVEAFAATQGVESGVWIEINSEVGVFIDSETAANPVFLEAVEGAKELDDANLDALGWDFKEDWKDAEGEEFQIQAANYLAEDCKVEVLMVVQ